MSTTRNRTRNRTLYRFKTKRFQIWNRRVLLSNSLCPPIIDTDAPLCIFVLRITYQYRHLFSLSMSRAAVSAVTISTIMSFGRHRRVIWATNGCGPCNFVWNCGIFRVVDIDLWYDVWEHLEIVRSLRAGLIDALVGSDIIIIWLKLGAGRIWQLQFFCTWHISDSIGWPQTKQNE